MNILLIGVGKWGKKYISTLKNFHDVHLTTATRENWQQLIDAKPDGVIISTPPDSHIEIALYALDKNIPVMIEKPLSLSLNEAKQLEKFKIPILVNHIHLFADAYQNLKNIIKDCQITHIESFGYGDGPIRNYSSLWDYGSHDIAMILDITNSIPNHIDIFEYKNDLKSLFTIQMDYKLFHTESTVGNGSENKSRTLSVDFDGLTLTYDDKERPWHQAPPLTNAVKIFLEAIDGKEDYRVGLDLSLKVIQILDFCQKKLDTN